MPNTKQAKKRLKQSFIRRDRNRADKTRMKNTIRKFREAVAAKEFETASELSRATGQLLDKFAAKGVIHKNKAARLKSRMIHLLLSSKAAAA